MEYKWHKYPEEKPEKEGLYLVCDFSGKVGIKRFVFKFSEYDATIRRTVETDANVFLKSATSMANSKSVCKYADYWTELPTPPSDAQSRRSEISRLRAKIEMMQSKIKELEEGKYGK